MHSCYNRSHSYRHLAKQQLFTRLDIIMNAITVINIFVITFLPFNWRSRRYAVPELGYYHAFKCHGSLDRYVNLRVAHAPGMPGTFSATDFKKKPLVSDPEMHHGTHVPWCMSGSLTGGGGEKVSGIPGACATCNFTYLVRPNARRKRPVGQNTYNTKWPRRSRDICYTSNAITTRITMCLLFRLYQSKHYGSIAQKGWYIHRPQWLKSVVFCHTFTCVSRKKIGIKTTTHIIDPKLFVDNHTYIPGSRRIPPCPSCE